MDNQAVIKSWNAQGGRSASLNNVLKKLFFTTSALNVALSLKYVPSVENHADTPSRRLSLLDSCLTDPVWKIVEEAFGESQGHTCDLMSLDSNVMKDEHGESLPHFTPSPSPQSLGVNLFAKDLMQFLHVLARPYVIPPLVLVGPVLRFLQGYKQSCTVVIIDLYPRKYWWPFLLYHSSKRRKLDSKGDSSALLSPSRAGWISNRLAGDLWAFYLTFI